ncbi:hypothetical protein C1645_749119 [Glomus cerebriforme]|uniref:Uncharacterized protein n=1 Tax=Glomus cerebriforme TaxID=658196 RepID=A0A397TQK2_9GLOM|nr:hypothetical protein C1645_749119 [Glomus cerebriforme]
MIDEDKIRKIGLFLIIINYRLKFFENFPCFNYYFPLVWKSISDLLNDMMILLNAIAN